MDERDEDVLLDLLIALLLPAAAGTVGLLYYLYRRQQERYRRLTQVVLPELGLDIYAGNAALP
ncbi:MAG: hypothetical protein ACXVKJ_19365 [Ilumatobacteraceae bacterium]